MTIRNAIFNCLIVVTLLAVPVQFLIDPSIENLACACIVLASSLTANLALGYSLNEAAVRAKRYTACFLASNKTLLGWHSTDYIL